MKNIILNLLNAQKNAQQVQELSVDLNTEKSHSAVARAFIATLLRDNRLDNASESEAKQIVFNPHNRAYRPLQASGELDQN